MSNSELLTLNPNKNILYHVTVLKENVTSTGHAYVKKISIYTFLLLFLHLCDQHTQAGQQQLILYII